MIRRLIALTVCLVVILAVSACSVNTDIGGTRIPNSRPDTRVTGQPPTLLEAGFAVEFRWTGADPDGRVVGYQWKISDNGVDGISPRDTLTVDPLTGAELHPWHYTTATDSTFLVLADQADFPGDNGVVPRSFRSHSMFIRAVDEKGAVDPSPAIISFTSTTIVPVARASYPGLRSSGFRQVPATVNMGWEGTDSDFELKTPVRVRFVWKPALTSDGRSIQTPGDYALHYDEILNFDDPEWSEWVPYSQDAFNRRVAFSNQPVGNYFLFAVQVQDTAGAVSVGLGYQKEVAHVRIFSGIFFPAFELVEPFLGSLVNSSETDDEIAGGQPLNFSWKANANSYNGTIVSYRHGWDLISVEDENDPGWAVPPGLSEQNLFADERAYQEGIHTFTLLIVDDSGQKRIVNWKLRVVPFVAPESQLELMVLDQVVDHQVQNWPDRQGRPRNSEDFRDPWWHFLADGAGGVAGINWDRDWKRHTDDVKYSDLVNYKVVLCYAKSNGEQRVLTNFRPISGRDQFVWLTPYQKRGGNLFLVGGSSMESFLEGLPNYMTPIIFDTREERLTVNGQNFVVGFGTKELPDGTRVQRGPRTYPYATAGIAALDWTSPNTKYIYNRPHVTRFDRDVDCVGLKGLVLDEEFKGNHLIGPGVIADTMFTNPEIDWHDVVDAAADTMRLFHLTFPYRVDEFVDANITSRGTVISSQDCGDLGPGGRCIEPMFRGIARFDYIRNYYWERGETDWPYSRYTANELDGGCGPLALTSFVDETLEEPLARGSALTNGQTFGYFSYKMVEDKPVRKADVYWGFDPYRFDSAQSRKAIRWVLTYFGLQINQ